MSEIARLAIRIESLEAKVADDRLKRLGRTSGKTEKATDGLTRSFKSLILPLTSIVSLGAGLSKLTSEARNMGVMSASLKTATGSAENAALAFAELERIAATTPFVLDQSVEAFIKLTNLGLTPSERAIRSYGNTASAMGKDLNQMIEAVADAATGEFERLKEFGIKSSSQGDKVAFTFRGITTTVGKNAKEIEGFLLRLGENTFGTAMADRMATVDGAISNLEDTWDKLFRTINNQGAGDLIHQTITTASEAVSDLIVLIDSGALDAKIIAITNKFSILGDTAAFVFNSISSLSSLAFNEMGVSAENSSKFFIDAFRNLPENVSAFVQLMVVELDTFVKKTVVYGDEILDNLKFWKDETFDLERALKEINDERAKSIVTIMGEREASINSFNSQMSAADELLLKYKQLKENAPKTDLGQFSTAGKSKDTESDKNAKKILSLEKTLLKEEAALRKSTSNFEEAAIAQIEIAESVFLKRLSIIDENVKSEERAQQLRLQIAQQYSDQVLAITQGEEDRKSQMRWSALSDVASIGTNLSSIFAGQSKAAFKVFQGFSIAEASINAFKAYNKALADPTLISMGLSYPAAGAALAAGLAQVSRIASMSPGGRGASGGAASAPSIPSAPSQPQQVQREIQQTNVINIVFDGQVVKTMVAQGIKSGVDDESLNFIDSSGEATRVIVNG